MSRVGKQPVDLPKGVEIKINGQKVEVKGPKGALNREFHPLVELVKEENAVRVNPREESQKARALWGLSRSLLNNMVIGVSQGYTRVLEVNGVGYRAELKGNSLNLVLGFSHPVIFEVPKGITASVEKNTQITLTGIDKELLGLTAARIRAYRPPEPYKGKGIKYAEETLRRKVGKAGIK
jgi:large subunit ribosomal protein L6